MGDEFVLPATLTDRSQAQLSHLFGSAFTAAIEAAPVGRWHGPVRSNYGLHLVRVTAKLAPRMPSFEEARETRARRLADGAQPRACGTRPWACCRATSCRSIPRFGQALAGAPAIAPFLERAR